MGGLVTRAAELHYSKQGINGVNALWDIDIRGVITLDTPHLGVNWVDNVAILDEKLCFGPDTHQGALDLSWERNDDGTTCANPLLCDPVVGLNTYTTEVNNTKHLKKYIPYAGNFDISGAPLPVVLASSSLSDLVATATALYAASSHPVYYFPRMAQVISQARLEPVARSGGDGVTLVKSQRLQTLNGSSWVDRPELFDRPLHPVFQNTDHSSIHDDVNTFKDWIRKDLLDLYAKANVPIAPIISADPQATSVVVGQPAKFTVTARGTVPRYEWRKGNATSSVPAPGAIDSSTYTIASTSLADNGCTYFVIVSNSAGVATSSVATLNVTATSITPVITVQPRDVTVNVGQSASFNVTAVGTTPRYGWRKGNAASSVLASGATDSPTYTIPSTTLTDNGQHVLRGGEQLGRSRHQQRSDADRYGCHDRPGD